MAQTVGDGGSRSYPRGTTTFEDGSSVKRSKRGRIRVKHVNDGPRKGASRKGDVVVGTKSRPRRANPVRKTR